MSNEVKKVHCCTLCGESNKIGASADGGITFICGTRFSAKNDVVEGELCLRKQYAKALLEKVEIDLDIIDAEMRLNKYKEAGEKLGEKLKHLYDNYPWLDNRCP